jgi:hypothetical protein
LCAFFLQFNERLAELYPEIFRASSTVTSESQRNFGKKWGWYQNIYAIAKGDLFKFDDVGRLKLHKALLYLAFEADKNKEEAKLFKKK